MSSYQENMRHVPLALLLTLFLCVMALLSTPLIFTNKAQGEPPENTPAVQPSPFDGVSVEARAAIVVDVRSGTTLYEKNADDQLPLASITKLLSVLVAHEAFPRGTELYVNDTALATEGNSGLVPGERWDIDELLKFILVTSSNDAVSVLEETYNMFNTERFVPTLDRRAREIGLSTFSIRNATGLDSPDTLRATNYGSARDIARLFLRALNDIPDILDATRAGRQTISSYDRVHTIENTNEVIDLVPNAVGGKTGFTDAAGGNLVMSFDRSIGSPVIIVVLGSSKEGRFMDMETLVSAAQKM